MPYLKPQNREYFKELVEAMHHVAISEPGELNYLVTELCKTAMRDKTVNYTLLNGIVGALECCKQEFIRRVVNPYEDEKIKENGDCY